MASKTRPVLMMVRAEASRTTQHHRSVVQRKKEAMQQEITQLKQQMEQQVAQQVAQQMVCKHRLFHEEIASLEQTILEQQKSIQRHKKWSKKWQCKYEYGKRRAN